MPIWNPSTGRVDGSALQSAIDAVSNAISVETSQRQAADASLSTRIDGAGGGSVTSAEIVSLIGVETSNRISADNALSNAISVVSAAVTSADGHAATASAAASAADAHASLASVAAAAASAAASAADAHASTASLAAASADNHASVASAAASVADAHASAASVAAAAASAAASAADAHASTASVAASLASVAASVADAHASAASAAATSVDARTKRKGNTGNQASITICAGVTVSGVSIALSSGQLYGFQFMIPFTATAATGMVAGILGPATNTFAANLQLPGAVGVTGAAPAANAVTPFPAQLRAINSKVSTTSITLTGTTLMALAWGTINPSGNGSLKFIIGPNTSGAANSGIVVLAGANLIVWTIP